MNGCCDSGISESILASFSTWIEAGGCDNGGLEGRCVRVC